MYTVRMILWLILIYVGYRVVQGFLKSRQPEEGTLPPQSEETHRDPVCGIYVAEDDAVVGRIDEKRVYFCSMACLEKYREQLENKTTSR
jgi:YHS domain-containing protein